MKKQPNKVDDFFRETLQDHTVVPSENAKAAFLKEAAILEGSRKLNRKLYFYLSAVVLLIAISAGLFFVRSNHSEKETSSTISNSAISNSIHDKKIKSNINIKQSELHPIEKQEIPLVTTNIQKTNDNNPQKRNNKNVNIIHSSLVQKNELSSPGFFSSTTEKSISLNPPSEPQTKQPVTEPAAPMNTQPLSDNAIKADSLKKTTNKTVDTLITQNSSNGNPKPGSGTNPKIWNVAIGGYYAPEWLFNTLEGEKYVNNFGIEGTFHFGRYSIRTGAGLSITKGTNELSVSYNDYEGSYNKLDSISFVWDAYRTHLIPTYHYTKTSVWDSVMKTHYAKIIKRYTYMQVPLILGYDFWKNDHFSIGLRIGPILSILLKTEQVSDNYDPGKDRIIQINMITPERIQTYWQFMGGINAAFCLSRKIGLEVEPELRYYFNSVYEKPVNNKKPWSTGIRIAFLFKE
jgi:hypothetical protein